MQLRQSFTNQVNVTPKTRGLTDREQEVLALVLCDLTAKEIGLTLNISEMTVKVHKKHIFEKMQVDNQKDVKKWAADNVEQIERKNLIELTKKETKAIRMYFFGFEVQDIAHGLGITGDEINGALKGDRIMSQAVTEQEAESSGKKEDTQEHRSTDQILDEAYRLTNRLKMIIILEAPQFQHATWPEKNAILGKRNQSARMSTLREALLKIGLIDEKKDITSFYEERLQDIKILGFLLSRENLELSAILETRLQSLRTPNKTATITP